MCSSNGSLYIIHFFLYFSVILIFIVTWNFRNESFNNAMISRNVSYFYQCWIFNANWTFSWDSLVNTKELPCIKGIYFVPSEILKVIAALLKNAPPEAESMEVRRIFLSDMIKLFNNSRENRRWESLICTHLL